MAEYPKKVRLKDNSEVIIRPMEKGDYDKLLVFFQNLPERDRMFLKDDVTDPETIKGWFKNFDLEKVFPLVAIRDDKIIADGTLHRASHGWSKHLGEIRIVIANEYRHKGLSIILLDELFHVAIIKGVKKMMAQVAENQERALSAFEKYGFVREATLKEHIIDSNGLPGNLVIMTRNMEDLIRKIEDLIISSGLSME